MHDVLEVVVPVYWPGGEYDRHVFKLGLGPCGKVVTNLQAGISNGILNVRQVTECGEDKQFVYPLHCVHGRIKFTTTESTK